MESSHSLSVAQAIAPQPISKAHKAFLRKIFLCHLIHQQQHNLLSLHQLTKMPRRTIQDTLAAMLDIGVEIKFVQDGERHNAGYYQLIDWGPINPQWIELNLEDICVSLDIEIA
ncbi:winged helix-turn-helix domain-containing protein [Shewanella olleyana]|uniref:winged helix-turn-helix domain-containing protein n=1 Tax=Shewanella olleyana TaxID=135626 RepID=UPI002010395E|nr:winged helix-turn-helix domain-containing protein [Shewanella olleyana]MCL1066657.1 winged helix-turn-helix domain-containing protein [Shewanella olleyana]